MRNVSWGRNIWRLVYRILAASSSRRFLIWTRTTCAIVLAIREDLEPEGPKASDLPVTQTKDTPGTLETVTADPPDSIPACSSEDTNPSTLPSHDSDQPPVQKSISSLATPIERHGRAVESSNVRRRNPRRLLTGIQVADCANATEQEAVVILRRSSLTAEGLASRGDGNDLLRVRSLTRTQPRGKPRPWPRDAFGSVLPQ